MSGTPRFSTNTKYDQVLDQYFPERRNDLLYQLVENQTDTLLLAILFRLEQMDDGTDPMVPTEDRPDQQEADLHVTEDPMPVTSHREGEQVLNWGFPATSVTVWGFDEPIRVAFESSGDRRRVPMHPEYEPFTFAPEGGFGASEARVRKWSEDSEDTTVMILAVK